MARQHTLSCTYPEGCCCGASAWNRLERERDWYRGRVQALERAKSMFREPELTVLCDILANGQLLPDPCGIRYGSNAGSKKS